MEKQEHLREEVKSQERIFIQKLEDLINNRYRPLLFDKYVFSLSKIQACYAAPNLTLKQSDSCAQEHTANYMEIDENYTRILRKYEDGITHCVAQCSKDLQPVILHIFLFLFKLF